MAGDNEKNCPGRPKTRWQPKDGWYRYYEDRFPGYVVLQKERFMYATHGPSADVLGAVMEYRVVVSNDGRSYTGGPDIGKITEFLQYYDYCYIVISGGKLIEEYKGSNHI